MFVEILSAGANAAAPVNKFGFWEALNNGGVISYSVAIILAIMSLGSFYIMFTRYYDQSKIFAQGKEIGAFWRAPSLREGTAKLAKNTPYRDIADAGLVAEEQHSKMANALEAHDWLTGSLARTEASIVAFLNRGTPFLATVGATAPFIGLFGTVVGIYKALIAIGIAGSASIDKVAGPVGEALIMTALGLLVAVPAVLAYNFIQARNKRIVELLSAFANDVLANINSNGAIKPSVPVAAAKPAAPAPKPVAK